MKKNVAVFFGGRSNEHDVSIITGMLAVNLLRGAGYEVMPVYLPLDGGMRACKSARGVEEFRGSVWKQFDEVILYGNALVSPKRPKKAKFTIDCALNCCHGGQGEDGTLAALLNWNGVLSASPEMPVSAIFMDKSLSKIALRGLDIPVVEDFTVTEREWTEDKEGVIKRAEPLGYPVIVKPSALGSSIGIRVAKNEEELAAAFELAFSLDGSALVEKYLEEKRDINCAACIIGGKIELSPLEEVFSSEEILSFREKYEDAGERTSRIPADVPDAIREEIDCYMKRVCAAFRVKGVVRADFLVSGEEVYFNELNTVPGSLASYLYGESLTEGRDFLVKLIEGATKQEEKKIVQTDLLSGGVFGGSKGCKRR
ncbi:MAG: ATP-grasp domain-containing protein [Clostridiales bacterium]|nr:ATP-grasp domain-containing protein [Clostridiales bacterium]